MSLVQRYFHRARDHRAYDKLAATGNCNVLSANPIKKANFISELAMDMNIPFQAVTYVCFQPKRPGNPFVNYSIPGQGGGF